MDRNILLAKVIIKIDCIHFFESAIGYKLLTISDVELGIYNLLAQKVTTLISEKQQAGYYKVQWDASGLASGVYLYRLKAGEFIKSKKLILMR